MVKERPGNGSESRGRGCGRQAGPEARQAGPSRKGAQSPLPVQPERGADNGDTAAAASAPPGVPELGMDAMCDRLDRMPEVKVVRRLRPSEKTQSGDLAVLPARKSLSSRQPRLKYRRCGRCTCTSAGPAALRNRPRRRADHGGPAAPRSGAGRTAGRTGGNLAAHLRAGGRTAGPRRGVPDRGVMAGPGPHRGRRDDHRHHGHGDPAVHSGVCVRPAGGYADRWIHRPELSATRENLVTLTPAGQGYPGLEERQQYGWGQQAMRLEQAASHIPCLRHQDRGHRFGCRRRAPRSQTTGALRGRSRTRHGRGWAHDPVGTGTHAAGIIAGADTGTGVIGIAVNTEIDVCQVVPDGCFSDLIAALDYCIEHEVDIAHIAVATPYSSALVSRKLADANAAGIACVAPAGDTAGPVAFPGSLPTVFTVGALGVLGPIHRTHPKPAHLGPQLTPEGLFARAVQLLRPRVDAAARRGSSVVLAARRIHGSRRHRHGVGPTSPVLPPSFSPTTRTSTANCCHADLAGCSTCSTSSPAAAAHWLPGTVEAARVGHRLPTLSSPSAWPSECRSLRPCPRTPRPWPVRPTPTTASASNGARLRERAPLRVPRPGGPEVPGRNPCCRGTADHWVGGVRFSPLGCGRASICGMNRTKRRTSTADKWLPDPHRPPDRPTDRLPRKHRRTRQHADHGGLEDDKEPARRAASPAAPTRPSSSTTRPLRWRRPSARSTTSVAPLCSTTTRGAGPGRATHPSAAGSGRPTAAAQATLPRPLAAGHQGPGRGARPVRPPDRHGPHRARRAPGIDPPDTIRGVTQSPLHGVSFAHTFDDAAAPTRHHTQYFEMLGHRAIDHDGWRAVCPWPGPRSLSPRHRSEHPSLPERCPNWTPTTGELCTTSTRSSPRRRSLAADHQDKLIEMISLWYVEAGKYGVLPIDKHSTLARMTVERPQITPARTSYTFRPGGTQALRRPWSHGSSTARTASPPKWESPPKARRAY